ncbi:MAG: nucleotide-binding protein, partial [Oscillospiraceae bacterium]|nr:nucleotide-binding protein [Oscillospiraceae bacterium]
MIGDRNVDVFIASSTGSLTVAKRIAKYVNDAADHADKQNRISVTVWDSYFDKSGGKYCWETILQATNEFDYAIILLGTDDDAEIRGQKYKIARDNVLIEAGAFMAKLPSQHVRCFFAKDVKIPSDFSGINHTLFSFSKSKLTQGDTDCLNQLFTECKTYHSEKEILAREKLSEAEAT